LSRRVPARENGVHPGSGRKYGGRMECHLGGTVRRIRRKLGRLGRDDRKRRGRVRLCDGRHVDLEPLWMLRRRRHSGFSRRTSGEIHGRCASGCEQTRPCCNRDLAGRDCKCGKRRHSPSRRGRGRRRDRPVQADTGADRHDRR
jgi:hypothetical protein